MKTLTQASIQAREAIVVVKAGELASEYDLVVIGGGITGAGIFHLAASQGLKVLLVEQQDFAWGTSSRSSKMVHGGLRYLAAGQWRMTRDTARQREALLAELPGLVELMPYMMLHRQGDFPSAALFKRVLSIYDKLAGCDYHKPLTLEKAQTWLTELSFDGVTGVSLFADGVTDDARLVLRLLQDGVLAGGQALNYAKVTGLIESENGISGIELELDEGKHKIGAKCVINATGSWASQLHPLEKGLLRPLRGSHLVLPFERLPVSACITFFHPIDKRPVYIYPWQGCTVIGTTDLDHDQGIESEPGITRTEVDYLLQLTRNYFPDKEIGEEDVISCWSGIRPILSSSTDTAPSKESREHVIWSKPGLISVTGGKLTGFHLMAEEVLESIKTQFPAMMKDIKQAKFSQPVMGYADKRLIGYFGHFATSISEMKNNQQIGISRCQWRELEWSLLNESVVHLDDLLLRRTRLGLLLGGGIIKYREQILALCCQSLNWSESMAEQEWQRFELIFSTYYSLPNKDKPASAYSQLSAGSQSSTANSPDTDNLLSTETL
ncbi:FAD dependent oxidoreductase [Shewanella sediminis HAW-EB3]|uniref:FAD dependent oxidoreductase n=1 Tax=Shewanella sediminis (strain HAW-EB3) TaxID=425104 RepID=A8FQT4_SHESH|nr:glycerol-3-phosphate dehydrogenase/oxidase [Shewanella sediminis]ABV35207.1 FAD dependent oxidoreductase [Shewanella sediminis HAW-EB3]